MSDRARVLGHKARSLNRSNNISKVITEGILYSVTGKQIQTDSRSERERESGQSARLVTSFRPPQLLTPQRAAVERSDVDGQALIIYRTIWSLSINSPPDL